MNIRNFLALAGMTVVAAFMAASGTASHGSGFALGQKIYKSWQCNMPVKPYGFGTWACTTIIVPQQVQAGGAATVTFQFKAKTTLKYVDLCFSRINSATCAYRHKYTAIKRGVVIKRELRLSVPMVPQPGTYSLDNYTRFYKPPKYAGRDAYWSARSFMCIVTPDQPDFQCTGGK